MRQTATMAFLISINFILTAQTRLEDVSKCIISYKGDSTLLIEKYEIDIKKEKVYYITPIMNYLDIKGEKYRTPIKIKKAEWDEILLNINSLYSFKSAAPDKQKNDSIIYSVDFYNSSDKIKEFDFYQETIPLDLKKLFDIIRNDD